MSIRLYALLCLFRVINVFFIQSQFDPDEYWQQLEPAYCEVFAGSNGECPGRTWEWKRRPSVEEVDSIATLVQAGLEGPVRSYASIVPTLVLYHLVKWARIDSSWVVARGPLFLNAILVAAPTDWAVWYIAKWVWSVDGSGHDYKSRIPWFCVLCSVSSWFNAYTLIRTYSNSLETLFVSLSTALVAPELVGTDAADKAPYRSLRACLAFFIGGITCSIRFTCLAAYIPLGILLALGQRPRSLMAVPAYLFTVCAFFGALGILATLVLDRYMYGFIAVPILGNLQFNVFEGNGSLYGTHPGHWYLTAGIPAITGLMLPFLLLDLASFRSWSSPRFKLWMICTSYVVAHSFSEHKEFRFLLPILPLFCVLSGERLCRLAKQAHGKSLLVFGVVANLAVVCFLGLVHQRAPIEVNRRVLSLVPQEPQTFKIHYLMGCHSTPLLSHLHLPPARFEPWYLDCSPSCRADQQILCESDEFYRDPGKFMEDTYFHCTDFEEGTCVTDSRLLYPDFLVIEASNLAVLKSRIATMGLKEAGRFCHGINGLRIADSFYVNEEVFQDTSFDKVNLLNNIELSLDQYVLFADNALL